MKNHKNHTHLNTSKENRRDPPPTHQKKEIHPRSFNSSPLKDMMLGRLYTVLLGPGLFSGGELLNFQGVIYNSCGSPTGWPAMLAPESRAGVILLECLEERKPYYVRSTHRIHGNGIIYYIYVRPATYIYIYICVILAYLRLVDSLWKMMGK